MTNTTSTTTAPSNPPASAIHSSLSPLRAAALDLGLLVSRLWAGGFMLFGHGIPKIKLFGKDPAAFPMDPIGIGPTLSYYGVVGAEVIAAAMIVLGLFTRLAAIPFIFAMAVAIFVVHASDPFFMTGQGGAKEPAFIYFAAGVAILLAGPGRLSLDHIIFSRLRRR